MKLEILSFSWELFKSSEVVSVTAMTSTWEATILKDHIALITTLKPWVVNVEYISEWKAKKENFAIWKGMLEVSDNHIKILIDMLINIENLDIDLAQKAKKEAIEIMERYKNSADRIDMEKFVQAEDQLLKSLAQLKLWNIK